jgi:UDP-N-acetylglucosamine acyltransferase
MTARIHPTAIIDPKAQLHDSVQVGPYSIIGAEVEIDAETWIGPHVVIQGPTRIGRENRIFQFASLGEEPQDKKYSSKDHTRLLIGDRNTIREYVTMNRGTAQDRGETTVGDDNWIMIGVHIAHDCVIGSHTVLANHVGLAGHVTIDDYVGLGGFTLIHQFCHRGEQAFTGGGTVLRRDVPPYVIMQGHPGEPRGINAEGLKRRGFPPEEIDALREAYKLIYMSGALLAEVKLRLAELGKNSPAVRKMSEFIESSQRSLQR